MSCKCANKGCGELSKVLTLVTQTTPGQIGNSRIAGRPQLTEVIAIFSSIDTYKSRKVAEAFVKETEASNPLAHYEINTLWGIEIKEV